MAAAIEKVAHSDQERRLCHFCNRQSSPYTCPRCHFPYCSSNCYKSPDHSQCSEMFYKDWVETYLRQSKNSPEAQKRIADILQRVHQQDEELDSDDEGDTTDLSERLLGLDLENNDIDADIWERLTKDEKQEFQSLLDTGEVDNVLPIWEPWWCFKERTKLVQEMEGSSNASLPLRCPPALNKIPPMKQLLSVPPSSTVKYNIINALYAYAYVTRFYNGDHHEFSMESIKDILNISKCLGANQTYVNTEDAVTNAIYHLEQNKELINSPAFVVEIIDEVRSIVDGPDDKNTIYYVLAALSDAHSLARTVRNGFKKAQNPPQTTTTATESIRATVDKEFIMKLRHAEKKLIFYMSWVNDYQQEMHSLVLELSVLHAAKLNEMIRFGDQQKVVASCIKARSSSNNTVKIEEI